MPPLDVKETGEGDVGIYRPKKQPKLSEGIVEVGEFLSALTCSPPR